MKSRIKKQRRLLRLVEFFNRNVNRGVTLAELEKHLKTCDDVALCSEKTVRRDIDCLRKEMEAPIEYERAEGGFYFSRHWRFPILDLDCEELFSMQLLGKMSQGSLLPEMKSQADHNMGVLAAMGEYCPNQAENLERLYLHSYAKGVFENETAADVVFDAWKTSSVLQASYRKGNGEIKLYIDLEPHCLFFYNSTWYVYARTASAPDMVYLSLLRFTEAEKLKTNFKKCPKAEVKICSGEVFEHRPIEGVELKLMPKFATYIRERQWFEGQQFTEQEDGTWLMKMPKAPLYAVLCLIFRFKGEVQALHPPELKTVVYKSALKMAGMHEDETV